MELNERCFTFGIKILKKQNKRETLKNSKQLTVPAFPIFFCSTKYCSASDINTCG